MLFSTLFLYQLIYTIYTVNFTLTGVSDYKNPELVISGYVDSNNKIVNSSQTYTSATSSIKVIYNTSYTISATAKSYRAFYMYIGDTKYEQSLYRELSKTGEIQTDTTFKITD